jgi:predicted nuclease of predicted toxin-antitoxin system
VTGVVLDENLPERLVSILARHGITATHVRRQGFGSTSDQQIWRFAMDSDSIVLTKDADYLDLAALSDQGRVILLVNGNMRLRQLCEYIDENGQVIRRFAASQNRVLILGG